MNSIKNQELLLTVEVANLYAGNNNLDPEWYYDKTGDIALGVDWLNRVILIADTNQPDYPIIEKITYTDTTTVWKQGETNE